MKFMNLFVLLLAIMPVVQGSIFDPYAEQQVQAIDIDARYDRRKMTVHSFKAPFYLVRGTISFWNVGGSAVITDEYVRLTPAEKSRSGYMWNTKPVSFNEWEVEMNFKIGSSSSLGADGMAFWYTKNSRREGPVFGNEDNWEGLALTFDTFDNDGMNDNPVINLFINDGTNKYNAAQDGKGQLLASCRSYYRNYDTRAKIAYFDNKIQVLIKVQNQADWTTCMLVPASLPTGYYFGLTAATGGLTDNHDVYKFDVSRLVPKGSEPDGPTYQPSQWQVEQMEQQKQAELAQQNQQQQQPQAGQSQHEQEDNSKEIREKLQKLRGQQLGGFNQFSQGDQQQAAAPQQPLQGVQQGQQQQQGDQQQQQQPPAQQQQQPVYNQQPVQPVAPQTVTPVKTEEIPTVLATLTRDVQILAQNQANLHSTFTNLQNSINSFTTTLNRDAQKLEQLSQQQLLFSEGIEKLLASTVTKKDIQNINVDGSNIVHEIQSITSQIVDLKRSIESKASSSSTTQQLDTISRTLTDIKIKVDATKMQQQNMEQSLKRNADQLSSSIETSTSFGFWTYFLICQIVFGVAFMWWKKYRDESSKKLL